MRRAGRLTELDAVRGLAAVAVMFGHSAIVFPSWDRGTRGDGFTLLNLVKYSPLSLIFAGSAAVIVFFVLSGFVLTLPARDGYRPFLIRRLCRIWIPYIAAVVLAMVVSLAFTGETDAQLSGWFNAEWQNTPGLGAIIGHLTLIGDFDNGVYDPVLWSLVHEMRISLVFPLLAAAVVLLGPARSLAGAIAAAVVAFVISNKFITGTDYFKTIEYMLCFVVGILLATHREAIRARAQALSGRAAAGLWLLAALALSYKDIVPTGDLPGPLAHAARLNLTEIVVNTIGATIVIVLAQTDGPQRFLRRAVPQYLGRISYSLYLVHAVVLLTVLHLLPDSAHPIVALPVVWALSLALATLMQRFVERPAQQLGRRLTHGGRPLPTPS